VVGIVRDLFLGRGFLIGAGCQGGFLERKFYCWEGGGGGGGDGGEVWFSVI